MWPTMAWRVATALVACFVFVPASAQVPVGTRNVPILHFPPAERSGSKTLPKCFFLPHAHTQHRHFVCTEEEGAIARRVASAAGWGVGSMLNDIKMRVFVRLCVCPCRVHPLALVEGCATPPKCPSARDVTHHTPICPSSQHSSVCLHPLTVIQGEGGSCLRRAPLPSLFS